MYLGTFEIDEYVPIPAATHRFSTGAAYAPSALTYSIYEEGSTTGLDEDVDMTPASPFDSITGVYYARRQLTTAAGFEANKTYVVVVKATVDSVAAVETHVFQVRALDNVATINGSATAAANLAIAAAHMVTGTVDDAAFTPTTTQFESDDITEATADHYKNAVVMFTSGALQYQRTVVTAYELSGGKGHFTVTALTEAPANNDTFILL